MNVWTQWLSGMQLVVNVPSQTQWHVIPLHLDASELLQTSLCQQSIYTQSTPMTAFCNTYWWTHNRLRQIDTLVNVYRPYYVQPVSDSIANSPVEPQINTQPQSSPKSNSHNMLTFVVLLFIGIIKIGIAIVLVVFIIRLVFADFLKPVPIRVRLPNTGIENRMRLLEISIEIFQIWNQFENLPSIVFALGQFTVGQIQRFQVLQEWQRFYVV